MNFPDFFITIFSSDFYANSLISKLSGHPVWYSYVYKKATDRYLDELVLPTGHHDRTVRRDVQTVDGARLRALDDPHQTGVQFVTGVVAQLPVRAAC